MIEEIQQDYQTHLNNLKRTLELAKQTRNYPLMAETKFQITIIKKALQTKNNELKMLFDMMHSYID